MTDQPSSAGSWQPFTPPDVQSFDRMQEATERLARELDLPPPTSSSPQS